MSYSTDDKIAALEREIAYRQRVYPQRIAEGKMKQAFADKQVAIFESILQDYREKAGEEQGSLF